MRYCRLYRGDIQRERWILEHWGEPLQAPTFDVQQLFNDIITEVKRFNWTKLKDVVSCAHDLYECYAGARTALQGVIMFSLAPGTAADPAGGIPLAAALLFMGTTQIYEGLDKVDDNSKKIKADYDDYLNQSSWYT